MPNRCTRIGEEPVYCGNRVPRRQRDELVALAVEKRIAAYEERASPLLDKCREGRVEVALCVGLQDMDLQAKCARCIEHISRFRLKVRTHRICEHRDDGGFGY